MSTTHQMPPTEDVADVVGQVLARIAEEFAAAVEVPVWSLEDDLLDERIGQALAVRAAADELLGRLVGEADDRHLSHRVGASSTRAHLVGSHRLSAGDAGRVMRAVRGLHGNDARSAVTEPIRRAQACGEVTAEQAVVISTAINRLDSDVEIGQVETAQADLIRYAGELGFDQLQHLANHLVELIDPISAEEILGEQLRRQERVALESCELVMTVNADGTSRGRWTNLPAAPTAMLKKALDACTSPRRHQTVEVIEPLDRRVETDPDQVPYLNRRGRAFAELIEHLPSEGLRQHGGVSAQVVVTVDHDRLRADLGVAALDSGAEISVAETRRLACNAGLLPMVLSGASQVLDLGRSRRLFDRYQRIALAQRDRGCVFPACERSPAWCEAHHLTPWSAAGSTDVDNGALVCSFHHHLVHAGDWELRLGPDGMPDVIPPPHVDPQRRPMRHVRFRPRPG